MSSSQLLVTISGALLIGWVVWYFFLAGRRGAVARASGDGIQRVRIDVQGGYTPSEVHVAAGRPVAEHAENAERACGHHGDLGGGAVGEQPEKRSGQ